MGGGGGGGTRKQYGLLMHSNHLVVCLTLYGLFFFFLFPNEYILIEVFVSVSENDVTGLPLFQYTCAYVDARLLKPPAIHLALPAS